MKLRIHHWNTERQMNVKTGNVFKKREWKNFIVNLTADQHDTHACTEIVIQLNLHHEFNRKMFAENIINQCDSALKVQLNIVA